MNPEIEEILAYLSKRRDYAIWAGLAQHLQLGLAYSSDVDIYTKSPSIKTQIVKDFVSTGWSSAHHKEMSYDWDKLQKSGTTFDVVYTQDSARLILPDSEEVEAYGYKLRVISKEWLFITKLGQMSWMDRSEEKRKRDVVVVNKLRELINTNKMARISRRLPGMYWKTGEI